MLFLDEVIKAGGQIYLVLLFDAGGFRARSVEGFLGMNWDWHFKRAVSRPTEVIMVAPNQLLEGCTSYLYATQVSRGLP